MSSLSQARRAEEKLGFILTQIGSIRSRLNSLAWQRAAFGALAWAIALGALMVLAAFYFTPLVFLLLALILGIGLLLGALQSLRAAWRMHVNRGGAASIADRRADLKGRLETIVEIGQRQKVIYIDGPQEPPLLWSYLIEDTLSRQEDFAPAKIEHKRISRSIYPFVGAVTLAALIFPLVMRLRARPVPVAPDSTDMTIDLNDLHLRAADPESDDGVEVHADAQTMRRLQAKLAAESAGGDGKSSDTPMTNMMNHARDLAGHLQEKLTGHKSPARSRITLKLADNSDEMNSFQKNHQPNLNPQRKREDADAHFEHEHPNDPEVSKPGTLSHNPDQQENAEESSSPENLAHGQRANGPDNPAEKSSEDASGDQDSNGGSSHGIGADPDSLFGNTSDPKLSAQGFEISIDARSEKAGPKAQGHPYLPPKVRTPLNSRQHPDEPIARASVPQEDRATIKRVFER
jgi:hypothetical protein